jgi:hypothetical protein
MKSCHQERVFKFSPTSALYVQNKERFDFRRAPPLCLYYKLTYIMELGNVDFVIDAVRIINTPTSSTSNTDADSSSATSFENIHYFLLHHKYPIGLNLNQKRTLRKAAANFSLIGKSYPQHLWEIFFTN